MSSLRQARENPKEQLFDEIDKIHAGMLGVEGTHMHMQPMAPQLDRQTSTVWFFTRTDTAIIEAIGTGARAHFCSSARITIITPASRAGWKFARTR